MRRGHWKSRRDFVRRNAKGTMNGGRFNTRHTARAISRVCAFVSHFVGKRGKVAWTLPPHFFPVAPLVSIEARGVLLRQFIAFMDTLFADIDTIQPEVGLTRLFVSPNHPSFIFRMALSFHPSPAFDLSFWVVFRDFSGNSAARAGLIWGVERDVLFYMKL